MPADPSARRAGLVSIAVGVIALVAYAVLGSGADEPGLPTGRLSLAALLVIVGVGLRDERAPGWGRFVAALLVGLIAADVVMTYLV